MTEAEIVLDSINSATGDRITTIRCVFPRIILAELTTHRIMFTSPGEDENVILGAYDADIPHSLSKNSASSRAVPITKMIERTMENPFIPQFRTAQKGMTSGEPVAREIQETAEAAIENHRESSVNLAQLLNGMGIEKGQANRYLEPHSHVEVLITATEWNNFERLRDHPAAQGEMQELARAIKMARRESKPRTLSPGEWHLPYLIDCPPTRSGWAEVSAARCARVSYKSLATGISSTISEDINLFDKLVAGNPKHLSPTEHPSQAQATHARYGNFVGWKPLRKIMFPFEERGGDLNNVE